MQKTLTDKGRAGSSDEGQASRSERRGLWGARRRTKTGSTGGVVVPRASRHALVMSQANTELLLRFTPPRCAWVISGVIVKEYIEIEILKVALCQGGGGVHVSNTGLSVIELQHACYLLVGQQGSNQCWEQDEVWLVKLLRDGQQCSVKWVLAEAAWPVLLPWLSVVRHWACVSSPRPVIYPW